MILLALFLCGCAGYRLGPTLGREAGATSVQINPFTNQTLEPRLTDAVATALRKQLQQDGTFRLNTQNDGDIVVRGDILEYKRGSVSYNPRDVITPRDFILTLTARVVAMERGTGRVLWQREVSGKSTVRILSDLTNAERQAVPLVADDLARHITALLVDGDW